jgi:hypothetical protein
MFSLPIDEKDTFLYQINLKSLHIIALIPSPSPWGRREQDSKSLALRERDLGRGLIGSTY